MTRRQVEFPWARSALVNLAPVLRKAQREGFDVGAAGAFMLTALRKGMTRGEELVNAAKRAGHVPHDDRAFGAIFAMLVRHQWIRSVGVVRRTKGHGTAGCRIWELVGPGGLGS